MNHSEKAMQNKKSLLQRLLFLYIALFLVIATGLVHSVLGSFGRGAETGMEMGAEIAEKLQQGNPRMIYLLGDVHILETPENSDTIRIGSTEINPVVTRLNLIVNEPADGLSPLGIVFRSVGGSAWLYFFALFIPLLLLAVIILMIMIIHSLRRSIREERPLDPRNVWYLRSIGVLTILSELANSLLSHTMNHRAAELLANSGFAVDTSLHLSYTMIIMGILILFSAEVFAIGQNLSEEQKLTI